MILSTLLERAGWTDLLWGLLFVWIVYLLISAVYNVTLHPLASYPGSILSGATPLPFVWNFTFGRWVDYITACHNKYGPVVRVAPNEISFISEESWKDIYGPNSPSAGRKWKGVYLPDNPQFQTIQGADNESHTELRRIFLPAFSEKNLHDQEPLFKEVINHMVDRIKRFTQENPSEHIDMTRFFMFVTFDVMGNFAFTQPLGMVEKMEYMGWVSAQFIHVKAIIFVMGAAYLKILQPLVAFLLFVFREKLGEALRFSAEQVELRVKRSAPEKGNDLWALIFRENKYDRKLTRDEMDKHALLFLLAGTETTATTMTGLLWYLYVNPVAFSKLTDEIRSKFKSRDEITMQRCTELPYLQACIEESLRVYAPIKFGLPRVTPPEGMVIDGRFVSGGTVVYTSIHAANVYKDHFRDADKFIPERWISKEYDSDKKGTRQPFIIGPRNCIGKGFAYHEMRLVIATLLFSFDLEFQKGMEKWGFGQKVYGVIEKRPLMINFKPRV